MKDARITRLGLAALIALALGACDRDTPPGAASGSVETSAPAVPLVPIAGATLAGMLPQRVGAWKLDIDFGDSHPMGRGRISAAATRYTDGERHIAVTLIDGARNPEAYRAYEIARATECDSPLLVYARLEVAGEPAVRILTRHPLSVQEHVLVAGRFLVQTDCADVEPEELERFLAGLPFERLRALKV